MISSFLGGSKDDTLALRYAINKIVGVLLWCWHLAQRFRHDVTSANQIKVTGGVGIDTCPTV